MDREVLTARVRESKGKGAAKRLRKNNQIPAIFYGPNIEPIMLVVDYPELESIIKQGTGENVILDLQLELHHGTETRRAMLKELLIDPIKDTCLHADFYEISMDKKITVAVPIHLLNTPVGVTNEGILQHVRRELTISCLPDKLIESLDIDVSGLDIGDSLHVRDIELPEGITTSEDDDLTIAVVAAPTVMPEEEEKEEEMVEVEEGELEEEPVKPEAESSEES